MTDIFNTSEIITYTFRFDTSDKVVQLNEEQLALIPYLSVLITHKDDFQSIQNENGEYVLNYPIEYTSFMAILHSITSKQAYTLFNELPEDEDLLNTLRLLDYLGIKSFSLPHLRYEYLTLSNSVNITSENKHFKYQRATLSEARQTAAEFVIALAKNEYKLRDSYTRRNIFDLVNIILFNTAVFNLQFRHHTLTVVKKRCYSFFSKNQQRQLQTTFRIAQNRMMKSSIYLSDDNNPLPDKFQNTFAWKRVYVPIENIDTSAFSAPIVYCRAYSDLLESMRNTIYDDIHIMYDDIQRMLSSEYRRFWYNFGGKIRLIHKAQVKSSDNIKVYINELRKNPKKEEAQSARSGRFNTLPKRLEVDKFKHRSGPKAQKYR